ncbi:MAG: ATP phosphoribosyltransferase [Victivallales bacterium]|nr:ATP phosphoribosyltransferase [Victivallales bacterium]
MLKIAIPNKGSLADGAVSLLREAGYRCRRSDRELRLLDDENEVEFIFLRPRDIAVYVGNGILDLGITGRDLAFDCEANVLELASLDFGRSKFHYAVPCEKNLTPDDLGGLRIATSYPNVVRVDLEERGISAEIIRLDGAVEISISLGVADVIADVVESGRTLVQAGLKIIGEPVMRSEAVLVAGAAEIAERRQADLLLRRLKGILVARSYAMIEYDIPAALLEQACVVTPGIESPTISPLSKDDWFAVKSMVASADVNRIMDELGDIGAKGIIITDIRTCRI